MGSHGRFGDDGVPVASDRSIGRADYLVPQCNLRDPAIARQNRRDGRGCHPSNLFSRIFSLKRAPGIDTTYTNDIVLVRLQRPVATNDDVHPVRMPGKEGRTVTCECAAFLLLSTWHSGKGKFALICCWCEVDLALRLLKA